MLTPKDIEEEEEEEYFISNHGPFLVYCVQIHTLQYHSQIITNIHVYNFKKKKKKERKV